MHYVHNLSPILYQGEAITIRWYGFMYLVGFVVGLFFMYRRYKRGFFALTLDQSQVLVSYLMVAMMICARLFYCVFYNPMYYFEHPGEIMAIWQGGLSFHGAAIGFVLAMWFYAKRSSIEFFHIADTVAMGAAQGIFWGRIGNFINGELYGRVSNVPWAIVFPGGGAEPRHPSQLYQGLLEGVVLFLFLIYIDSRERHAGFGPVTDSKGNLKQNTDELDFIDDKKSKKKFKVKAGRYQWTRTGVIGCTFLYGYGVARFIVEFFREPDSQLGFFAGYFTMGQLLCAVMIVVGVLLLKYVKKHPHPVVYP